MKNGVLAIITLGALLASVFGLSGCYEQEVPEPEWKVSGYFKYTEIEYEEDGATKEGICIVKLTDEGGEQERIYIPEEIDGKPVVKVGMVDKRHPIDSFIGYFAYGSEIKNTKKVFLPMSVNTVNLGAFERKEISIKIFTVNSKISLEDYNSRGKKTPVISIWQHYSIANTFYNLNYESAPDDGCFLIDYHDVTERLFNPEYTPKRVGYYFDNWYKEPECINTWDFENDTKGEEDVTLYAKWKNI